MFHLGEKENLVKFCCWYFFVKLLHLYYCSVKVLDKQDVAESGAF